MCSSSSFSPAPIYAGSIKGGLRARNGGGNGDNGGNSKETTRMACKARICIISSSNCAARYVVRCVLQQRRGTVLRKEVGKISSGSGKKKRERASKGLVVCSGALEGRDLYQPFRPPPPCVPPSDSLSLQPRRLKSSWKFSAREEVCGMSMPSSFRF
jgi:hypothetical protein